jgi:protocatechuate 3,4-dioxygenase beta subunit
MERKDFLKNSLGFLGMAVAAPSLLRAGKTSEEAALTVCSVTNSETAGPFPTHIPSSYVLSNIVSDRTGIPLTVNITINNTNANCGPLAGAIVDIWHCDKDGNYSEYGGTGMQPTNYTTYHFLRGRQTTNASGVVSFTTIFPGWYTGRATHIHVHVYNAAGTSLLVTQIAFPEGTNSAVVLVNASTANGYTKGMTGYTYNASDNVFSDGVTNELSSVSGSVAAGYALTHTIFAAGPVLGIEELSGQNYEIGQNYPNPFVDKTTIPLQLELNSKVTLAIYDLNGRLIATPIKNDFQAGTNNIVLDRNTLPLSSGYYIYKVTVDNANGSFTQNKKMLVR